MGRTIKPVGVAAVCLVLAGCGAATWRQAGYWTDSMILFRHAIQATEDNAVVEALIGNELIRLGRPGEGLTHLRAALMLDNNFSTAHQNLAVALLDQGYLPEGLAHYEIYAKSKPDDYLAQSKFGAVLLDLGLYQDAIPYLRKSVEIKPGDASFHFRLGNALAKIGQEKEAIAQVQRNS